MSESSIHAASMVVHTGAASALLRTDGARPAAGTPATPPRPDFQDSLAARRAASAHRQPARVEPDRVEDQRRPAGWTAYRPSEDEAGQIAAPVPEAPADTGFLAQVLAQEGESERGASASGRLSGFQAYGRASGSMAGGGDSRFEVLEPFPRLASGRVLDLAV